MWIIDFPGLVTVRLPYSIYRSLSKGWTHRSISGPQVNISFFLCSFPFWLRIAQYMIGLRCVEAVQSVLYISRSWAL